jgi:predicted acylesterase/phospholipase RssA
MFRPAARAVLLLLALLPAGCILTGGGKRPYPASPEIGGTRLIDVSGPDAVYEPFDPQMVLAVKRSLRRARVVESGTGQLPPVNVLAISGGGSYGAFDVGVLAGWTAAGDRPAFDMVTGVSTGAFIATYAFLGPKYDDALRDGYVYTRAEDVYETRPWITLLAADSVARSRPLKKKIDEAITAEVLREVAAAHAEGRRLYVGTTNLDTRRFVIWDMGAIASRDTPEALDLYRKIILASGSVPGFFPPVLIDVEVDGKHFQELHVDGGATAAVFVPMALAKCLPSDPLRRPGSAVYVISSGKLYVNGDPVKRAVLSVTYEAISSMLYAGTRNDVFRIFYQALLCGMDFHLIAVPQDLPLNPDSLSFDPHELRRLYDIGREMGQTRKGWRVTPPGAEIPEQTIPRTGTKFRTEK